MQLTVANKRRSLDSLQALYPNAMILDVTSKGALPWIRFSPFFPHGNIPVPFSPDSTAVSVEGIWQGLKVFEHEDIDVRKLSNKTMKGIKRATRSDNKILGHRAGLAGQRILTYREARYLIYLPAYKWVLENDLQSEVRQLNALATDRRVVLLDYETNGDIENLAKPLSHASLIIAYIENRWPTIPSDLIA